MSGAAQVTATGVTATPEELRRAWEAVRQGRFRDRPAPPRQTAAGAAAVVKLAGPVVTVVGAHGWSGASTTALLLAEACTAAGDQARLVEAAPPARSGLVAAALTEDGTDPTGRWRLGRREGGTRLQRLAVAAAGPADLPPPPAQPDGAPPTVTIVDAGWVMPQLAAAGGWLAGQVWAGPLVVTARSGIPGLRHLDLALAAVHSGPMVPVAAEVPAPVPALVPAPVVVLVGASRVPRWLAEAAGTHVQAALRQDRLVTLPDVGDLAVHGLTSDPLPRQLTRAGRLLRRLALPPPERTDRAGHGTGATRATENQGEDHRS